MQYDKKLNFVLSIVSMYPHKFGNILYKATKSRYVEQGQVETFLTHSIDQFFMELIHMAVLPEILYDREGWYWKINTLNIKPDATIDIEINITITASRALSINKDSATFRMALDREYGLVLEVLDQVEGYPMGSIETR